VVCLDPQGKLLANAVIYLSQSAARSREASQAILDLVQRFHIEAIAIGNGTASRETEEFIRGLSLPDKMPVVMVNENGASIYSASAVAREEFPDQDITVRGAVSIGRRLLDPLAELVKIDPKSIGVGQYQHDVDQGRLKSNLDETVMNCVNEVGHPTIHVPGHAVHNMIAFWVHGTGIEGILCIINTEEPGSQLKGLRA
jgi:uncharacterized protein